MTFNGKSIFGSNVLIAPFTESGDLPGQINALLDGLEAPIDGVANDFGGDHGEVMPVYLPSGKKLILLGLGSNPMMADVIKVFRLLSHKHHRLLGKKFDIDLRSWVDHPEYLLLLAEAVANGMLLGTYNVHLYHTKKTMKRPIESASINLVVPRNMIKGVKNAISKGVMTAETQMRIFDLMNAPGNKTTPQTLAKWARSSGRANGFKVTVFNKKKAQEIGLHALLAVNRGSEYPAEFIIMEYKPKGRKTKLKKVGIVGKGVTFDTGGYSIKGSNNMYYMKSDMGGAAAVLGTMELVAKLQLPVHLIGIVPTTDNMVDALAIRPGDVIDSYSGKTIEVIDTDAEGRLILADGLAYMVKHYAPDIMINLATLTGSSVRALGYEAAALFSKNDDLANQISIAGTQTGERCWRMPLWDAYHKEMKSDVADIKNLSTRPVAGAITAGKFLEFFTDGHPAWAHLDIAGVALGDSEFSSQKSATAYGVRLLRAFIENL